MTASHTITIFGMIAFYLVLATAIAGYAIEGLSEDDSLQYPTLMTTIPTLEDVNFTSSNAENITHIDYTDSWEFDEIKGLYSTNEGDNKIFFQGAAPEKVTNTVSSTYYIKNPNDNLLQIIVRETSIISTVYIEVYENKLDLWDKNGLIYPLSLIYPKETYLCDLSFEGFYIRIDFNPTDGNLQVYIDGELIINTVVSHKKGIEPYIGVYTNGIDTQIISLDSNLVGLQVNDMEWGIIQFLGLMTELLSTSIDDTYLPLWLNVLLIHVPLAMLILVGIIIIRGGGG